MVEEETDRCDEHQAQQVAAHQLAKQELEKEIMSWKVQFFDQQYERCAAAHVALAASRARCAAAPVQPPPAVHWTCRNRLGKQLEATTAAAESLKQELIKQQVREARRR